MMMTQANQESSGGRKSRFLASILRRDGSWHKHATAFHVKVRYEISSSSTIIFSSVLRLRSSVTHGRSDAAQVDALIISNIDDEDDDEDLP